MLAQMRESLVRKLNSNLESQSTVRFHIRIQFLSGVFLGCPGDRGAGSFALTFLGLVAGPVWASLLWGWGHGWVPPWHDGCRGRLLPRLVVDPALDWQWGAAGARVDPLENRLPWRIVRAMKKKPCTNA